MHKVIRREYQHLKMWSICRKIIKYSQVQTTRSAFCLQWIQMPLLFWFPPSTRSYQNVPLCGPRHFFRSFSLTGIFLSIVQFWCCESDPTMFDHKIVQERNRCPHFPLRYTVSNVTTIRFRSRELYTVWKQYHSMSRSFLIHKSTRRLH